MLVLDRTRFLFSFAGAAVRSNWTAAALRAALAVAAAGYDLRTPGLAPRVLRQFPEKPTYGALLAFLVGDARLTRALSRPVDPRRSPAPTPLAAWQLPPLPTEAALAAWLNLTPASAGSPTSPAATAATRRGRFAPTGTAGWRSRTAAPGSSKSPSSR